MKNSVERIIEILDSQQLRYPSNIDEYANGIVAKIRPKREIAIRAIVNTIIAKFTYYVTLSYMDDTVDLCAVKADCNRMLNKFGVEKHLYDYEKDILKCNNNGEELFPCAQFWQHYATVALLWVLRLRDDIDAAGCFNHNEIISDIEQVYNFIDSHDNLKLFLDACHMRSKNEILDMRLLFDMYWWNIYQICDNEKDYGVCPESLLHEAVAETYRALDWLALSREKSRTWNFDVYCEYI